MSQPLLAAIDLGTNTARLLIGTVAESGSVEPVRILRRITRLGGGFTRECGLSAEARKRTIAALQEFADEIRLRGVDSVLAVATSAVRDAINGPEFCAEVEEATGIRLTVVDGDREGLLTRAGVYAGLDDRSGTVLIFDVGGGSTEYTLVHEGKLLFTRSLPLGVVRLTEGKGTPAAMTDKIDRELAAVRDALEGEGLLALASSATLVGTAGTATTLAAISMNMTEYDYRLVNNYLLSGSEIAAIYERLLPLAPAERLSVPGMEKGREDLIVAGMLITLRTMALFGADRMKVSDYGLLEGVLLWAAGKQ
jgi:exopolyphosphatase/guanosine-5'-triphosphate,3'-diphosphate pyrophosphatase